MASDAPAPDRSAGATGRRELHLELVSLRGDFSKPEHYDSFKEILTAIVNRLEGTRHADYRTTLRLMKHILSGLEALQDSLGALLGPPWSPREVRDMGNFLAPTHQALVPGEDPPVRLTRIPWEGQVWDLVMSAPESIALSPRKRRKLGRDLGELHEAACQELRSRLGLRLDASKLHAANLDSRLHLGMRIKFAHANEQHQVRRQRLGRVAAQGLDARQREVKQLSSRLHASMRIKFACANEQHQVRKQRLGRVAAQGLDARQREAEQLSSRLHASMLSTYALLRERHDDVRRRLGRVGAGWWPAAANRVLLDWQAATPHVNFLPEVDDDDRALVKKWLPHAGEDAEEWDRRVLSARRAEKSSMMYYLQFERRVEDIAIRQLSEEHGEWRTHDLSVNERPIDVNPIVAG